MGKPSNRERREYMARASTERDYLSRHYGLGRHPASQGYGRGGTRGERAREIRAAVLFVGIIGAVVLTVLIVSWVRSG